MIRLSLGVVLVLVCVLAPSISSTAAPPQVKTAPQKSGTEVTLMSVYFRDANLGWAVGSGGTVLKTTDGGQKWKKQLSGTPAQLMKKYGLDAEHIVKAAQKVIQKRQ